MLANRAQVLFTTAVLAIAFAVSPARADEIWVAPTYQQDVGGLGIGSNALWPVTAVGAVRLAFGIPGNLQTFQGAKVALIPHAGGSATLNVLICAAQNGTAVVADCVGPLPQAFTGVANQLVEVDITSMLAPRIGTPGANYLAVVAYTVPTTTTDHIVGLRFSYAPQFPAGAATLGANTFGGTQTAPAFVGNGSGLTSLPFPAGAATLGANTFTGVQTAPSFAGSGTALTGVAKLTANTFNGAQTISNGNITLDDSTATTGTLIKNGLRFLHNFGSFNTFLGVAAGNFQLTNSYNTGVGQGALNKLTTGGANTAVGTSALNANTTGEGNAAVGVQAMVNNTTGSNNVVVGYTAMINLTTGSNNVAIGYDAGAYVTTGHNNVFLNASGFGTAGSDSNLMYLGNDVTQKTVIGGIRGKTTGAANAIPVLIDSNGQLGTISSSIRFKEDVHDMAGASERLLKLRPVTFRYTQAYSDGAKPIQYGLIAEEVADVFPELAVRDAGGRVETVHYETLNVLLVNELQKQQRRIDALEQKIDELLAALVR